MMTTLPFVILLIGLANPALSQIMTTSFTYDFSGNQLPSTDLTLQGDAHFPSDSTFLRLTAPQPFSIGRAVHPNTITLRTGGFEADFEATLKFLITPVDSSPADGLTFFMTPVDYPIPPGSTGGNFGLFNPAGVAPHVFAVEFDTMINEWDPDYIHVGIDNQFRKSGNETRVDDAIIGQEVSARISYDCTAKRTSVCVTTAGGQNFEVSHPHNLTAFVPDQVQVGVSASTGDHVAIHDIISLSWTSTIVFG